MSEKIIRNTDGKVYSVTTKYDPDTGQPDEVWTEMESPADIRTQAAELIAKAEALETILGMEPSDAAVEYEPLVKVKVDLDAVKDIEKEVIDGRI